MHVWPVERPKSAFQQTGQYVPIAGKYKEDMRKRTLSKSNWMPSLFLEIRSSLDSYQRQTSTDVITFWFRKDLSWTELLSMCSASVNWFTLGDTRHVTASRHTTKLFLIKTFSYLLGFFRTPLVPCNLIFNTANNKCKVVPLLNYLSTTPWRRMGGGMDA
jgi:hypothetical protein